MTKTHTVTAGDSISSLADSNGHFWETLWDHPGNAELKEERKNPETLYPGDMVVIPELRVKKEGCETARCNRFRRRGVPIKVAFTVREQNGRAFAGKKYQLDVGNCHFEGETDQDGYLEHWVPTAAQKGMLTVQLDEPGFPEQMIWELAVGHLPPLDKMVGLQWRLNNLGYDCGRVDGILGPRTKSALARFREHAELTPSEEPDEAVRAKLKEAHGS